MEFFQIFLVGQRFKGEYYDLVINCRIAYWDDGWCNYQRGESMGCIYNIFAGLVGSFVGQSLFGFWGPSLAGMAILPSILGAIIVIAVVDLFFGK